MICGNCGNPMTYDLQECRWICESCESIRYSTDEDWWDEDLW